MVRRDLRVPTTVTSDGARGLIVPIEAVFPRSFPIRCRYHRLKNFNGEIPPEAWPEVKAQLVATRHAPGYEQARARLREFIDKYKKAYPPLVRSLQQDVDTLLNHLKVPFRHRRSVRTTNLVERNFREQRR
jgi:transposase-like protein